MYRCVYIYIYIYIYICILCSYFLLLYVYCVYFCLTAYFTSASPGVSAPAKCRAHASGGVAPAPKCILQHTVARTWCKHGLLQHPSPGHTSKYKATEIQKTPYLLNPLLEQKRKRELAASSQKSRLSSWIGRVSLALKKGSAKGDPTMNHSKVTFCHLLALLSDLKVAFLRVCLLRFPFCRPVSVVAGVQKV